MLDETNAGGETDIQAGASGEAAGAAAGAGEQTPPEYLSKSDFDAFRQEITGHLQRLTPAQAAREEAKSQAPGEPQKPDVSKYNFKDPAELDRYNRDNYKYHRHLDRQEEAKEAEKSQSADKAKKDMQSHQARVAEYGKTSPAFSADMKAAAGKINVTDPVARAVYGSKNGHLAVHYMAKNPGADQELNLLADSDGPDAVRERIGEMAAEMRAEQKLLEGTATAAGQRPPRQNLRGGGSNAGHEPTAEERYKRFHGLN
jgi:hypothetical protein